MFPKLKISLFNVSRNIALANPWNKLCLYLSISPSAFKIVHVVWHIPSTLTQSPSPPLSANCHTMLLSTTDGQKPCVTAAMTFVSFAHVAWHILARHTPPPPLCLHDLAYHLSDTEAMTKVVERIESVILLNSHLWNVKQRQYLMVIIFPVEFGLPIIDWASKYCLRRC